MVFYKYCTQEFVISMMGNYFHFPIHTVYVKLGNIIIKFWC